MQQTMFFVVVPYAVSALYLHVTFIFVYVVSHLFSLRQIYAVELAEVFNCCRCQYAL